MMESSQSEFDSTLGGSESLPYSANSLKFAASRSVEIAAMTESILHPSKTKLIFQNLPVHMRRRVMSHNAKRLPRKLRVGHLEQLKKSGLAPKQKRPSRKYRRRPGNLLLEYNRRQQKNIWLETHIWHAKRFHMIERWGYKIAYAPCDKAFRACYRASSAHCLLQDISYYTPIQIIGPSDLIKEMFNAITNCECGLGIAAKAYIDGKREGLIHLFGRNNYPFGYIGNVHFIWHSRGANRHLWLFVHPSQFHQVESLLTDLVSHDTKLENYETEKRRKICNKYSDKIKIKPFPGIFNRFRLTGPKSHAVLVNTLKCIEDFERINKNKWVSSVDKASLCLEDKQNYWNALRTAASPSQLPPHVVIGLTIRDPRLSRPEHRTKAVSQNNNIMNIESLLSIPQFVSNSPLWDTSLHDIIKKGILSNTQYIKHITKTQLVPGEVNINDPALQSIPIVLIQRPGLQDLSAKKLGYGSGWDIIVPPGYGLHFWQTFVMFGARSGGLRETESLLFESGQCYLPPDSDAGREEEKRVASTLKEKYFKLPPSKRVNFPKLAIVSPFICPWEILLKDWSDRNCNDNLFILRNRQTLSILQDCIRQKNQLPSIENASSCLVAICLKMVKKGNLKRNAVICLPETKDVEAVMTLFEPHHQDPNEKLRKEKRTQHRNDIKRKRRQKAKLRKTECKVHSPTSKKKTENSDLSDYVKSMRELWVPSAVSTVRHSCSRQILGFLTHATFSFSESCSCGIGYIPYNALDMLLKTKQNQVLVRNTTSRKYRLANISIIK